MGGANVLALESVGRRANHERDRRKVFQAFLQILEQTGFLYSGQLPELSQPIRAPSGRIRGPPQLRRDRQGNRANEMRQIFDPNDRHPAVVNPDVVVGYPGVPEP